MKETTVRYFCDKCKEEIKGNPVIPLQKNMEPFEQFSLLKYVDLVVGLNKTDLRENILCDRCKIEALEELLKDLKARGKK